MAEASTEYPVKATPAEVANGWSDATLSKYLAERNSQKIDYATRNHRKRVEIQNTVSFNPYRW